MRLATLRRPILICAVAALLAVALGACGSSSSSSGTPAAATSGSASGARYQARLSLAKCFRAHGINVPDPAPGGGPGGGTLRALQNYPRSQMQSALQACQQYVRKAFAFANLSPAQIAQFRQQFVKFAECMRSHGINIPDPSPNALGGFGFRQSLGNVDRSSPACQSTLKACQSLRPRFGRGGGPGAGAPAGGAVPAPSA